MKTELGIIIVVILVILVTIPINIYIESKMDSNDFKVICSQVEGTPAWFQNGKIASYGYQDVSVNDLIENNIYFLYATGCGWCAKQIELWGDDFNKLNDEGLAINCLEFR